MSFIPQYNTLCGRARRKGLKVIAGSGYQVRDSRGRLIAETVGRDRAALAAIISVAPRGRR